MLNSLMRLYDACFPGIVRERKTVERILSLPENHILLREEAGQPIAAAVIHGSVILMLCVLPEKQGRGIGSALLQEAEAYILAQGHAEVRFCDGPGYITPGVPDYPGAWAFFEKRGYTHSWGDCECVDMSRPLLGYEHTAYSIGDTVNGYTYRWAVLSDIPAIADCVDTAEENFTKYYRNEDLYNGQGTQRVLIAEDGRLVCGTLIVSAETEQKGVGSVGCTATRADRQNRGIATTMVKLGTKYLFDLGLPTAFLGYTYTDIVRMYGRAGYAICRKYMMAVKTF
ncbi:MAG: GNAT family N-acetyltransferase [Clostridia bacterium]|nr:GNAT family N-acetyltransferase [Clostridia bacterium]